MSNIYFYRLDDESKKMYLDKLEYNGVSLPDPFDISLRLHLYKPLSQNNVPELTFGDIYIFLVETAKVYSRVEFKNFKTLTCYKVASNRKVRDILAYKCSNTEMCVLTGDLPGDEGISRIYRAWVVVSLNGLIQNGHCTCMDEIMKGCPHIAALLLSVEISIRKGMLHNDFEDSSYEKPAEKRTRLELSSINDKFSEKNNSSSKENPSQNPPLSTNYKEKLKALKRIVPYAPIFTLLCDSDISSTDEEDSEDEQIYVIPDSIKQR